MSMLDGLKELISEVAGPKVAELISGPEVAGYLIEIYEDIVSFAISYILNRYILKKILFY